MSGGGPLAGTAHIELIPDDEPESAWRTSSGSWRQYLREPTEGERLVDQRILHHLPPYIDPYAYIEPDPRSFDIFKVPEFTEAETVLIRALVRIHKHDKARPDPWQWLKVALGRSRKMVPLVRPDLWHRLESTPDANREIGADQASGALVQQARVARIEGDDYRAVQLYSRAARTIFPKVPSLLLLEAQDATVCLGLNSSVLNHELGISLFQMRVPPQDWLLPTSLEQLATILLLGVPFDGLPMPSAPGRCVNPEYLIDAFKRLVNTALDNTQASTSQVLDTTLLISIACFPLLSLGNLRSPTLQEVSDRSSVTGLRDYCTDLLFYMAAKVGQCNVIGQKDIDTKTFVQYRLALACRDVKPYMKLPRSISNPGQVPWAFGFDAVRALGHNEMSLLDCEAADSALWAELSSAVSSWSDSQRWNGLSLDTATALAQTIDNFLEARQYAAIDQLCIALLLIDFPFDITVAYGIRRFLWRMIAVLVPHSWTREDEGDKLMCHPRGLHAVELSRTKRPGEEPHLPSPSNQAPKCCAEDAKARLLRTLRCDCNFPHLDDINALYIWRSRSKFLWRIGAGKGSLNLLSPFLRPQFAVVSEDLCSLSRVLHFPRNVKNLRVSPANVRHVIGLGRLALGPDNSSHAPELEEEIKNLREILDDIDQWVKDLCGPAVVKANEEILRRFEEGDLEDYKVLYGDILELAVRAEHPVMHNIRAMLLLFVGESQVDLAACLSDAEANTALFRACDYFKAALEEAGTLPEVCVESAEALVNVQARLWNRGALDIRGEQVLETCLHAERGRRFLQLEFAREGFWPAVVESLLMYSGPLNNVRSGIHGIAHDVCLSQGREWEAWWWMQKAKADVSSGVITQQRTAAELVGYLSGDKTGDRNYRSIIPRARKRYTLISLYLGGFQSFLSASRMSSELRSALPAVRQAAASEFAQFKSLSESLSIENTSIDSGRAVPSSANRLLWVEWFADVRKDVYHLCVCRLPGAPYHLQISSAAIRPSQVAAWLRRCWRVPRLTLEHAEAVSRLRELDALVAPLRPYLGEDDIVILCPTGGLHSLPLHALHVHQHTPLIASHAVLYAASLRIFAHCVSRSVTPAGTAPRHTSSIAATYHSLDPRRRTAAGIAGIQDGMRGVLESLALEIDATFRWDEEVTKQAMLKSLRESPLWMFVGHCVKDIEDFWWSQCLVLSGEERLYSKDMLKLEMPNSLLMLIGCGTSEQSIVGHDEPMGLIVGAMTAGATSVAGTLWSVHSVPAVRYAETLVRNLRGDEFRAENNLIDLARAHQQAVLKLRAEFPKPRDWAGYVLHGSPVMRDLWPRSGEAELLPGFEARARPVS